MVAQDVINYFVELLAIKIMVALTYPDSWPKQTTIEHREKCLKF